MFKNVNGGVWWYCYVIYWNFEWYKRFSEGWEDIEGDEHLGQRVTARAKGNIKNLVKCAERQMSEHSDDHWYGK